MLKMNKNESKVLSGDKIDVIIEILVKKSHSLLGIVAMLIHLKTHTKIHLTRASHSRRRNLLELTRDDHDLDLVSEFVASAVIG